MKKLLIAMMALLMCMVTAAMAETAIVTTPGELMTALMDDAIDAIEITADMTITDSYVMQAKDVTILSDVVFHPAPDDGFFVKSWEVPAGATLTVQGSITTQHTFEGGFSIAQVYVNGGTLDVSGGAVRDRICFNAGTVIPPENGFSADVEIGRYLYEDVTEQDIMDSLSEPVIWLTTIQMDCTVFGQIVIPDGKELNLSAILTIADGASVTGIVTADPGCGVILQGSARINDTTVPAGMDACRVIWDENGTPSILPLGGSTAEVTTPEELMAALEDDRVESIEITEDMTLSVSNGNGNLMLTKDVTILSNVVFYPAPDDGFFVKSLEVPSGVTLTVLGSLNTQHTFDNGFAIAQIYVNGGTLDVSGGSLGENCNVCFNSGTLIPPPGGFNEDVAINRFIYNGYSDANFTDQVLEAMAEPLLKKVWLQSAFCLTKDVIVPAGKCLVLDGCWLSVNAGVNLGGDGTIEGNGEDCGLIMMPGSVFAGESVTGDAPMILRWQDDAGTFIAEENTLSELTDSISWRLYPNGKLELTGTGALPDFGADRPVPWDPSAVSEIEIGHGITAVGAHLLLGTEISQLWLPESIAFIADNALEELPEDAMIIFIHQENDYVKNFLNERRLSYGEGIGNDITFRSFEDNGWTDMLISNSLLVTITTYALENGQLVNMHITYADQSHTTIDYEDGHPVSAFSFNAQGERTYMAFYTNGEEMPSFWVKYNNYQYLPDDVTSVDYEASIMGEHRIGTDVLRGQSEDMVMVSSDYILDDGRTVHCAYEESQHYFRQNRSSDGSLISCGYYSPMEECLLFWNMTDGRILNLPESMLILQAEAFQGVDADKLRVNAKLQQIAEAAVDDHMLIILPEHTLLMRDLREDQLRYYDGDIPAFSPSLRGEAIHGGAVWSDVATILPWTVYQAYGDAALLRENYPMMRDYSETLIARDRAVGYTHLVFPSFTFGDWLALDGMTPTSLKGGTEDPYIQGIYYMNSIDLTARAAAAIGQSEDAARYSALASEIRSSLLDEYVSPGGNLTVNTQTGYVLALTYGLYRDKAKLIAGFRRRLEQDFYRIKSGFTGAPLMLSALFDNGLDDIAWRMLLTEEFPGWLYAVNLGATTIWERWNSLEADGTISGTGMNSLNHYAYGSVCETVYSQIAGLRCAAPGWKKAVIAPHVSVKLKHAAMTFDSAVGTWKVAWEILPDGTITLKATIPEGATARVELPYCSENPVMDVEAGEYSWAWKMTEDLLHPYSSASLLMDLLDDEETAAIVRETIPVLFYAGQGKDNDMRVLSPIHADAILHYGEAAVKELDRKLRNITAKEFRGE